MKSAKRVCPHCNRLHDASRRCSSSATLTPTVVPQKPRLIAGVPDMVFSEPQPNQKLGPMLVDEGIDPIAFLADIQAASTSELEARAATIEHVYRVITAELHKREASDIEPVTKPR